MMWISEEFEESAIEPRFCLIKNCGKYKQSCGIRYDW